MYPSLMGNSGGQGHDSPWVKAGRQREPVGRAPLPRSFWSLADSGCVERRMIIRTNPPGALAYVDDNEVGLTPVAISPIYYGSRKIRLVKDGCETLT